MSRKIQSGEYLSKPTNTWRFRRAIYLITFSTLLGLLSINVQAQDYTTTDKKAIEAYEGAILAFDSRNHDLAISYLEEAVRRDSDFIEAYLLKFEVYSELGNIIQAEYALEDAIRVNPDYYRNAYFFLGMLEMQQGKYAEAEPHFERFKTYQNLNPEMVERTERELVNCRFALEALRNPVPFEPKNLGEAVNTTAPEYYPAVSADNSRFIFTRLIDDARSYSGKNEDFYWSTLREGTWFPAVPLNSINTEYNEGAPALSADGKLMVFTACELMGSYGEGRSGLGSCDLFISEFKNGAWQAAVNMGAPVNTKYWETQPSLSPDGNTVYFIRGVPSREGGVKDQDIYYANRDLNGKWGIPVKLSPLVNTSGREESVQIHPDGNTLYFSSDGHPGMGGLDLYVSRRDSAGRWQKPINLGYPINTFRDENSLLVNGKGDVAYFASDRDGGFGDLDLYQFDLPKKVKPIPIGFANGLVVDASTKKPVKALFTLTDIDRQRVKQNFQSDSVTGEFTLALPIGRTYAMSVSAPGYFLYSQSFTIGEQFKNQTVVTEIPLQKLEEGKSIVLKNIFFDTDQDVLKPQSYPELQELVRFIQANPDMKIEISGHTDNQGSEAYNQGLSERRALAVKNYLVPYFEYDSDRITTVGYGSKYPIASNDSEETRVLNRRTEFKILP